MLPHVDALARLLKSELAKRGWSQAELSRRSGVPLTTLNGWINGTRAKGNRGPNPDKLRKVAEALGIDVTAVFEAAGRFVPTDLSEDEEREFLATYRALTKGGRALMLANMKAYVETHGGRSRSDRGN